MNLPLTPIRFLYRAVDLYGHKTGVVCGEQRFSYADFGEHCERLAAGLRTEGVQAGDRVGYLSFNNHQLLAGYYGVPLAGAIVMPLNVRLTAPELVQILNHSGARMLLLEKEFTPLVQTFRQQCPGITRYVALDESKTEADFRYEELLSHGRFERPDPRAFDEQAVAELFYTSGSTGSPKGVMLSHRTVYMHALGMLPFFNEADEGVELHTIPLFHANGWGRPQTATLHGNTQVMVRRFDPVQVLRLIQQERATFMAVVPTMASALLHCPQRAEFDVSSLKNIGIGGAAASPELVSRLEQAFHCEVNAAYGLTETSPAIATSRRKNTVFYRDEDDRLRHHAMAGWPLVGVEIRVVDGSLEDVPRDGQTIGEILVRGDCVMDGYYNEPEATAAVMTNGWLHTGDMAVWDRENYVQIVDRKKDIIISGGENISSIELEKEITAHPGVLECAVVAAPDDKWGEVPAAIVVCKPEQVLDAEELTEFLRKRMAKFKLPRIVQFVEGPLPKGGTGKILKRLLREPFWVGKEKRVQGL